jgi:signal transduction histidine kinase
VRHRALVLGLLCSMSIACSPGLEPGVIRIERVALAESADSALPPEPGAPAWRPARLPDDWRPRGSGLPVWCRAEFTLAAVPVEPLQLLVVSAGYGAEVFLDGEWIATTGRSPDAVFGRREPVWVSLPPSQLSVGRNEIALRIAVRPEFAGYLTPLLVGPPDAIQPLRASWSALLVLPDFLALFVLATAAMEWLAYRSERRREWLWVFCGLLVLGLGGLPWRAVDFWLWPLSVAVATACVACGLHRATGLSRRPLERAAFAALALLAAGLAFGPPGWRLALAGVTGALCIAIGLYVLRRYHDPRAATWLARPRLLSAGMLASFAIGANDLPTYFLGRAPLLGVPLFPVAHAVLMLARVLQVVSYLGDRLAQVRALNGALEASHERVVRLEREQATRGERLRLQRELHDGLGSQLVGALAVAERAPADAEAVRGALRGALGELRIAVDSLDDGEGELVEILGRLRARLEPLVHHAGIAFSWQVGDVASARRLSPDHAIHLLRVLQEAIANAVKHAAPRLIELRSGEEAADGARLPFVEVCDDGRGFTNPGSGRGLANMHARAEQLGGRVEIASDADGTRVRVWLAPAQELPSKPS